MLEWSGMLRFGAGSILASALLTVLVFSSVRTFQVKAVRDGRKKPFLALRLDYNLGPNGFQAYMIPRSLDAYRSVIGHSGRVSELTFEGVDDAVREIPEEADVELMHRWVDTRALEWDFGTTRIECNGRRYAPDRSGARFFTTLTAIALSPLLLWSAIALAILSIGRRKEKTPP